MTVPIDVPKIDLSLYRSACPALERSADTVGLAKASDAHSKRKSRGWMKKVYAIYGVDITTSADRKEKSISMNESKRRSHSALGSITPDKEDDKPESLFSNYFLGMDMMDSEPASVPPQVKQADKPQTHLSHNDRHRILSACKEVIGRKFKGDPKVKKATEVLPKQSFQDPGETTYRCFAPNLATDTLTQVQDFPNHTKELQLRGTLEPSDMQPPQVLKVRVLNSDRFASSQAVISTAVKRWAMAIGNTIITPTKSRDQELSFRKKTVSRGSPLRQSHVVSQKGDDCKDQSNHAKKAISNILCEFDLPDTHCAQQHSSSRLVDQITHQEFRKDVLTRFRQISLHPSIPRRRDNSIVLGLHGKFHFED